MNFFNIIILTAISTVGTRWLIHVKNLSPIRASTLLTLTIVTIMAPFDLYYRLSLEAAVLGGTFVGMTEKEYLPKKSLLSASFLFATVFYFIIPFNPGFGGALGVASFTSCIVIYLLKKKIRRP